MKRLQHVLLAAAAAALSGCSLGVADVDLTSPPPLAIAGPRGILSYTVADDEDANIPGIQLLLRVDVQDEAIEQVDLALADDTIALHDVVAEDLSGRRAAFFAVTLAGRGEHEVVASTLDMDDVSVRAVLIASDAGATTAP